MHPLMLGKLLKNAAMWSVWCPSGDTHSRQLQQLPLHQISFCDCVEFLIIFTVQLLIRQDHLL